MLVKLPDDDCWKLTDDCDPVGGFAAEGATLPDREVVEGRRGWREEEGAVEAVTMVEAIQMQPPPIQDN